MTSLNLQGLPNDIESLKEIIIQERNLAHQKDKALTQKDEEIRKLEAQKNEGIRKLKNKKNEEIRKLKNRKDEEIKKLKFLNKGLQHQLEKHLRDRFGHKSEKKLPGQKDESG